MLKPHSKGTSYKRAYELCTKVPSLEVIASTAKEQPKVRKYRSGFYSLPCTVQHLTLLVLSVRQRDSGLDIFFISRPFRSFVHTMKVATYVSYNIEELYILCVGGPTLHLAPHPNTSGNVKFTYSLGVTLSHCMVRHMWYIRNNVALYINI